MEIHNPKTQSSPYFQRDKRAGSLYDKTRVKRTGAKSQMLERANTNPEDSPLTLAFNRFTKQSSEEKGTALSRNNSCPKQMALFE